MSHYRVMKRERTSLKQLDTQDVQLSVWPDRAVAVAEADRERRARARAEGHVGFDLDYWVQAIERHGPVRVRFPIRRGQR
jgi:hypothetical protein